MQIIINSTITEEITDIKFEQAAAKEILTISFNTENSCIKEKINHITIKQNNEIINEYTEPVYILSYNQETCKYTITIFI